MSVIELVSILVAACAVAVAAWAVVRSGRDAGGVDERTLATYLEQVNGEVRALKTQQVADTAAIRAQVEASARATTDPVSYTHLRAHET